jgi:hypothetical protein
MTTSQHHHQQQCTITSIDILHPKARGTKAYLFTVMLCRACQNMVDGKSIVMTTTSPTNLGKYYRLHHAFPYQIEAAAQDGCPICGILWESLSGMERELIRQAKNRSFLSRLKTNLRGYKSLDFTAYGWSIVTAFPKIPCHVRFQFGSWGSKTVNLIFLPANGERFQRKH